MTSSQALVAHEHPRLTCPLIASPLTSVDFLGQIISAVFPRVVDEARVKWLQGNGPEVIVDLDRSRKTRRMDNFRSSTLYRIF